MQRLIFKVDTYVNNVDEIRDVFVVSYQNFEVISRNVIRFWSGGTAAFFYGINKFCLREYKLLG